MKQITDDSYKAIVGFFEEWLCDNRDYDFDEEPELQEALVELGVMEDD